MRILNIVISVAAGLLLTSCGEYVKVQKSTDFNYKYDYAKRAFEQKKYVQAATLFKDCATVFKATDKAEECLYLLAMSNYENKDYVSSGAYFQTYYQRYPKGKFAEPARFFAGYGYYLDSPEAQLDAIDTLADCGITRILTHGGAAGTPIEDNLEHLSHLIDYADDRLTILPGGGISTANRDTVAAALGVSELHGTKIVPLGV